MKFIYHLISRPLALLGAALMFCSFQAHAGYVEPRFAYMYGELLSDLGQVKNAIIFGQTNGSMQSDYWTWEEPMSPEDTAPVRFMNGIPLTYYLPVRPTKKFLDEYHLPPGEHKFKWGGGTLSPICPDDYQKQMSNSPDGLNIYVSCYKPDPCNCETAGNPVVISSGTKTETAIDYQGAPGLEFVRNYRSDRH
ncbi:MAG: hypothetical protein WA071_16900, partial [Undibacterium umbellatum]|uniref:hypothetical protein n=1 Tax=Undibacterium umbellatum TaxID=2762300 RepID=UPI003BB6A19F